jgi:hypothetical protein
MDLRPPLKQDLELLLLWRCWVIADKRRTATLRVCVRCDGGCSLLAFWCVRGA